MRHVVIRLLLALLILATASPMVWAQATAQISGTVKDPSGAVLPGVEITVTQTETGIARSTITNETGSYVLANLAIGPYRLEATLPGFRTYAQTGIVLTVNSNPAINPVLEVGAVAETVEVQANAAMVETRSSGVGQVIENSRILELPLNGRNVTDLITLAGAAVRQADSTDRFVAGSPILAVGGGLGFGVDYTLDGANHVNFLTGLGMLMPFPDATQEFKVETSGLTAQNGRSSLVAAVTKSGTNEYHATLFEFVRNDLFNARNYFATKNSTLKRNQFGGTFGGPIAKNKLFFFGGYQGTILRQDPADLRAFVPTAAMMAGDWTAFASPACNAGRQIALRAPFVNNRMDPALYSKPAVYVVNKLPKTANPCGEITYGATVQRDEPQYVGKVDYQRSSNHSIFGRALLGTVDQPNGFDFAPDNLLVSGATGFDSLYQSYTLGDTYLIGANMVQSFRLSVNRVATLILVPQYFSWCDAGVAMYCHGLKSMNPLTISGGFGMGSTMAGLDQRNVNNTYTANEDISLVRGPHQFSFGASVLHGRQVAFYYFGAAGQMDFNGSGTGLGLSDFMNGRISSFFMGAPNSHNVKATWAAVYAADTWKAKQNLTVNYGIRWEPYLPQTPDSIYQFDYQRFRQGIKSSVFVNAPAGMYYPGDPGFPGKTGIDKQWWHFAPRAGLAWDVNGDGRTSIRASYSYGYAFVPGNFRQGYSGAPPWGNRVTLSSPPGGLDNPWQGVPGGSPYPYVLDKNAPFTAYGLFYTQARDLNTPNTASWNVSVQKQFATDWLFSGSYIANRAMHLWGNKPINPATYFPGGPCTLNGVTYNPCSSLQNTDQRRRFALENPRDGSLMGFVAEADDGGTQIYHGMLLSVERRASRGVTIGGNYTWSHCIGPYATVYNPMGAHPNDTYTNPTNRLADQGDCDSDRRHIFNFTGVADTPQFANRTLRAVASGWRLSGIYRLSSGNPLNILAGSDRALNGVANQRGSQILDNPYGDRSAGPLARYLNPLAFAAPAVGTYGNVGRNSLAGPGTWSFDLALSRAFRFREAQRLEFRAEAYNVTNSFRPGNPITTVTNANFGVIRTSAEPRILQFALKYFF